MWKPFFLKLVILAAALGALAPAVCPADDDLAEGDFLAGEGLSDEAVTSYLRFLFQNPGAARESEACHKISRAFAAAGENEKAERYARLAVERAQNESERRERRFARCELFLSQNRCADAWNELAALAELALSRPERLRRLFLEGVTLTLLRQWEGAGRALDEYFALSGVYPIETAKQVRKLLSFGVQARYLDPQAARILSYLIPGSGQLYAGDPLQGLNSLLVTGAAGALTAGAIASGDYPDAAAAFYFVFQRFFFGSPFHAERLAREKNEARQDMIARAVLELLAR